MAPGVRSPSFAGIIVRSCKRLTWFRWNGSRAGTAWLCCCFSPPPTSPPAFGGGVFTAAPRSPGKRAEGVFSEGPWKSSFLREAPPGEAQSVQRGEGQHPVPPSRGLLLSVSLTC